MSQLRLLALLGLLAGPATAQPIIIPLSPQPAEPSPPPPPSPAPVAPPQAEPAEARPAPEGRTVQPDAPPQAPAR